MLQNRNAAEDVVQELAVKARRRLGITAGLIALALIAALVAIHVSSLPPSGAQLPTAQAVDNLVASQFITPRVGFVELRSEGYVMAGTADGGRTWHQVLALRGQASTPVMQWLDARTGIVVAQRDHPATLWRTTDGGLHWQSHAIPLPPDATPFGGVAGGASLETAFFLSPLEGWVVYRYQADCGGCGFAAERFVYETSDGGIHWTEVGTAGLQAAERQLRFFSSSWGVLSSPFYELDVTHDGGRTWHESQLPGFTSTCQVVCEVNGGRQTLALFAGGRGVMTVSWCIAEAGSPAGKACYASYPFKPTEAHLYGTTDGGLTWRYLRDLPLSTGSVQFLDERRAVEVGADGVSWTSDAGATWSAPQPGAIPSGWYLVRSQFMDAQHGWLELTSSPQAVLIQSSDAAYLYQLRATTDGGATWHDVALPRA